MRLRILLAACLPLALTSCQLSETLNVFKLKFSSNGYDGPSITGPSLTRVAVLMAPKTDFSLGGLSIGGYGLSARQVLDSFNIGITFKVNADNSGNSEKAAFGTDLVKPTLQFRMMSKSAAPIDVQFQPFSVDGGQVGALTFPVKIPLSAVTDDAIIKKVLAGDAIPYFLTGGLTFHLMGLDGKAGAADQVSVDLLTDSVPTRPSDSDLKLSKELVDALF